MRYGFVTCVELGLACIEELIEAKVDLVYLGTLEDDLAATKSGRVYLDELARRHDICLHKFRNINDDSVVKAIVDADLDWLFIIGWSQIARLPVLSAARYGALGMHPTLLPQGRGRAAIPWAILKGLPETGVTLFRLDEGTDTGPILGQIVVPLSERTTANELYRQVVRTHRALIKSIIPHLEAGTATASAQDDSRATYWPGRRPSDGEIFPSDCCVADVDRLVRATTRPYPGAFVRLAGDDVMRIWAGHPRVLPTCADHEGPILRVSDGEYCITDSERDAG